MAASAGSLVISLGLDAAQYTAGLTKAQYQARQFGEAIGNGIRTAAIGAASAITAMGASAVAAAAGFDTLVKAAGDFQDLAEKTGGSAEGLASLAVAAAVGGQSMEAVAAASIKLTKNLTGVDDESKAAGAAVAALGLNLKDFKALAPEDQIEAVAKALNGFEDGAGKTAVAVALLGKSGADMLPFLKELGAEGGRQVILTKEQIALADEYADKQAKAKAQLQLHAQAIATSFIPALTSLTQVATDLIKEFVGIEEGASKLANQNAIQEFANRAIDLLGRVADAGQIVARGFDIVGTSIAVLAATAAQAAKGNIGHAIQTQIDGAKDLYNKVATIGDNLISDRIKKNMAAQKAAINDAGLSGFYNRSQPKPELKFNGPTKTGGGGGSGDDPTKKILDNNLKALENAAAEERDILASRNKMLDLYNGQALISNQAYFEGRRVVADAALSSQQSIYDQEIAALQAFMSKAGKATDREAAQGKVNDLLAKKARLSREAAESALEWAFKEQKSAEDYRRSLDELNAQVLELQGNLVEAAGIRFDLQNADKLKRFMVEGNEEAVKQLDYLKQITAAQALLNEVQEKSGRAKSDLQRAEERISRDQQNGTLGQIEGLVKLGQAREKALGGMKQAYAELQALDASGVQLTARQRDTMKELGFEIEDLSTRLDPLADKFNTMFGDKFADAFASIIDGSKSVKSALTDMVNGFATDLAKMAAQDVFKSLISGGGSATGGIGFNFGGLLSGLFGGSGGGQAKDEFGGRGTLANPMYVQAADVNGLLGKASGLFGGGSDDLGDFLKSSGLVGGSSSGGSGWLDMLSGLFGKAGGGLIGPNSMHRVNENGPELLDYQGKQYLINGNQSARVTANHKTGGGGDYNQAITFVVPGNMDRSTQSQLSAKVRRESNTAARRLS